MAASNVLDSHEPTAVSHAQPQEAMYLLDRARKQKGSSSLPESKLVTADLLDLVFAEGSW